MNNLNSSLNADVPKIIEIFREYSLNNNYINSENLKLIIIMGSFADFDSIEYAQLICKYKPILKKSKIELKILGIGNQDSKKIFCNFTGLDFSDVDVVPNNYIHNQLNLNSGLDLSINPLFNLLLMCTGIGSPKTIKEVLRGYVGDLKANQIFSDDDEIVINNKLKFSCRNFSRICGKGYQRPFELATRRLINMVEILGNWNTYTPTIKYLTQRGATIILSGQNEILYYYKSNSLLSYSSNMAKPLEFLKPWLSP